MIHKGVAVLVFTDQTLYVGRLVINNPMGHDSRITLFYQVIDEPPDIRYFFFFRGFFSFLTSAIATVGRFLTSKVSSRCLLITRVSNPFEMRVFRAASASGKVAYFLWMFQGWGLWVSVKIPLLSSRCAYHGGKGVIDKSSRCCCAGRKDIG